VTAREPGGFRQWAPDNAVPIILAAIAFGGSAAHWVKLAETNGQRGLLAPAVAICVDLGALMAARERERDLKTGRVRKGWASWPTIVMAGAILLTLAGNVASAQRTPWGVITALIPGMFLLLAISLMERRANERHRRRADADKVAGREAEAERARQADEKRERERQAEAERQAEEARQRQAERHLDFARRRAQIVTPPSGSVTPPVIRLALSAPAGAPQGDAPAASGVAVMRAYWDQQVAAGRVPTGAELLRAAGLSSTSSLGRQMAAKWRRELGTPGLDEVSAS
jgi:hypothetical protein